jgi:hypothetical protein
MPGNPSGPFTTTGDHDEPIMANGNSIAEGERGNSCRWCPALTPSQTENARAVRPFTKPGCIGISDCGYGNLTTFVDCKNAIIDNGNTNPDLGGSHRGMGVEIGAGLSRNENRP